MPSPKAKVSAIVVAGGRGTRFGGLKQFADLEGIPVAERSIEACRCVADEVVLVAPPGTTATHGADQVVGGGDSRAASVRAGLAVIDDEADLVVVHDAARPLAAPVLFERVLAALEGDEVAGAVCGLPVTDTIKMLEPADARRRVTATLERAALIAVQTPQAFRVDALRKAHAGEPEATDDAALIEAIGGVVVIVDGDEENLKLTSTSDLATAARCLRAR
jgi:2-C-methyl-D-erythritol 4-phosphate cytidylyltransferase